MLLVILHSCCCYAHRPLLSIYSEIVRDPESCCHTIEPPVSDHLKSQRLNGHLWEVVVYKNQTTGRLFEKRSRHIYFIEDNSLHGMCKLRHHHRVVPCCHWSSSYIRISIVHTVNKEIRECIKRLLKRGAKQPGKVAFTAGYFAWCPALNETPDTFF